MLRTSCLALTAFVVLLVGSSVAATAAPRMPIGFYDDNSFRWAGEAATTSNLLAAKNAGASILHVTADWSQIAPKKPSSPLNGSDPAYVIQDLDVLVARAGTYGLQVMINISGAPRWANGDQTPNHPPKNLSDLTRFAQMLATRYHGQPGRGLVLRWSIWNEPNLGLFLTPQFDANGKIVSPATYAKIYMAAYKGIKAGNKQALVAAGETSNRGRNTVLHGASDGQQTVAPATFAYLLSKAAPKLPFDAWATHPYPTSPNLPPTQKVAFPNVTLTRLNQFGTSLETWFNRHVPIWVTEYGEQTKPQYPIGVSYSQQAKDAKLALKMAQASPFVEMFVWFTIRDSSATWQSGLLKSAGAKKPAYAAFASVAKTIDGDVQNIRAGYVPIAKVYLPFLAAHNVVGAKLDVSFRVYNGTKLIKTGHTESPLAADQSVSFSLVSVVPPLKSNYTVVVAAGDKHGQKQTRTVVLVTPLT